MAGNDTEINLRFKVNDDGSIVLDKIGKSIQKVQDNTTQMNSSLGIIKFDSVVNLAEKAYQLGERMYGVAKATASALNDIERSAKVANMTTTEYQKMAYAAKMSDVSIEELSTGMKKLSMNMDAAQKGSGEAAEKFDRIGISVTDSSGKLKGLNDIMLEVANKFSTWEDGPRKIAIAIDLFGRSGERLIPYLNQGAAGIRGFYEEAERLGIVLDEKMIKAGSELEDKFKRVESWWDSLKKKIVVSVYDMITAVRPWEEEQEQILEAYQQTGQYVPHELFSQKDMSRQLKELEEAEATLVRMEAQAARTQAPSQDMAKATANIKMYNEVNTQLLKDQESTLRRMVELQTQLNKSGNEAIAIADRLGVGTKASLTQWIETDIIGEYEKLLGSKLFSGEEMEQFKTKYTEALQYAMGAGGWGGEFRQIEEAIKKIQTMKVEDTGIEKTRNEMEELKKSAQYLEKFTGQIKLDDNDVVRARDQIVDLRTELTRLVNESWNVRVSVTGYGSTERPIMEKIAEITGAFESMGSTAGNMVLKMNMEDISAGIRAAQADIMHAQSPTLEKYGVGVIYSGRYFEKQDEQLIANAKARIAQLQQYQTMLSQVGSAYNTPAASTMEASGGGGGSYGGGVSVNIGTINVNGENAAEIAENLDAQLADLYLRDRSKLKNAIRGSA